MNGRDLTLGIVAGLAVAGLARQRGGRNHLPTLYHVTTREASDDILRNGFLPGWGDIGLGVYFYGSEREAMRYAQKGGWDGALRGEHVVVLAVRDPHIRRMGDADLDLSWDRSRYADMWFWEERNEDAYMVPSSVSVASDLGIVGANRGARKGSASLNLRGGRNTEALRSDLLPAALRDTHDLVVTEIQKRTSHWEPTGVEKGVTSVPYTYHTLVATLYPKGERQKESRLGQVAATSERKRETPTPLRGRCAADLVQLGGPDYAFGVTGAFVDERLRGKGVGQALYAALVEAAGAHGGALTSNRCLTGTELTSADALRVWERLGRRYAVEGEVAWHRKGSAARGSASATDRIPYKQKTNDYSLYGVLHNDPVSAFNDVAVDFFDSDYWYALGLDEDNATTQDAHAIILDAWTSFGGRSDDRVFVWHELYLQRDARGKGFGRATVARIEDMLRKDRVKAIFLQAGTLDGHHSLPFWTRLGYEEWPVDYGNYDDRILWKRL